MCRIGETINLFQSKSNLFENSKKYKLWLSNKKFNPGIRNILVYKKRFTEEENNAVEGAVGQTPKPDARKQDEGRTSEDVKFIAAPLLIKYVHNIFLGTLKYDVMCNRLNNTLKDALYWEILRI